MATPTRVALVTGGNRGIGFEICAQLGEAGVHVVLTSRVPERGQEARDQLAARGLAVEAFTLDVCDAAGIEALARHLEATHGGLDMLVNNAGVAMSGFDAEVVRVTVDTNFSAPLALYERLLPIMRPGGRVVMVSSGMGDRSALSEDLAARFDGDLTRAELIALMGEFVDDVVQGRHEAKHWPSSAYRMSKLGLNKLTEILAAELDAAGNPKRILVNAACPGWVRTEMGGPHAPTSPEEGADTPVWLALLGDDGPQGGFFRERQPITW